MKKLQLIALAFIIAFTNLNLIESKGVCKKGQHWDTTKAKCVNDTKKSKSSKNNTTNKAQDLVDAINDNNTDLIITLLSTKDNLTLVQTAIGLVPDNSAVVRCSAGNPDCGLTPAGKVLKSLQAFLEGKNKINESFVQQLLDQYVNNSQVLIGKNPATNAPQTFEPADKFAGNGLVGNYFKANQIATIHDPSAKNNKSYSFKDVVEKSSYSQNNETPEGLQLIGSFMSSPKCAPGQMCIKAMVVTNLYGKPTNNNLLTSPSAPIEDARYYRTKGPRYARPAKLAPSNGFRAPDEDEMRMHKKMVVNTIYSQIDQAVDVTFLDEKNNSLKTETIEAQDSFAIPQGATNITISLDGNSVYQGPISPKSYMIIKDKKGNISLQAQQIYY